MVRGLVSILGNPGGCFSGWDVLLGSLHDSGRVSSPLYPVSRKGQIFLSLVGVVVVSRLEAYGLRERNSSLHRYSSSYEQTEDE